MEIMPYRQEVLRQTLEGYERTGVPLVAANGDVLGPAGLTDDVGIYAIIPRLARTLDLSLPQAIDTFFIGIVLVALVAGIVGCFRCFRSWWLRGWSVLMLVVVSRLCLQLGDVYIVPATLAVGLLPWYLYFFRQRTTSVWFVGFAVLLGAAVGTGHWVRGHAGTPILLFVLISLALCAHRSPRRRAAILAALFAGLLIPTVYFHSLVGERDRYLAEIRPGYEPVTARHPLWHNVYIGFGFLRNVHGIRYSDDIAAERARQLQPGVTYMSAEYQRLLRGEVLRLLREDPWFVIRTLGGKFGVLLRFLLFYANIGLFVPLLRPKGRAIESAFWVALAFGSLYGLLVMPYPRYALGFIALAALYGLYGLERLACRPLIAGLPAGSVPVRVE
jgi:hypothetical protein